MNLEKYKKLAKFKPISIWVFLGTFSLSFALLWQFIEPYGGLCKFPLLKAIEKCEENAHIAYSLLVVVSLILAIVAEAIRSAVFYWNSLKNIITELQLNNADINPNNYLSSEIEKDLIINFLTGEMIESEFEIPLQEFNSYSVIFLNNFFDLCIWLGLYNKQGQKYSPAGQLSPFIIKSAFSNLKQSTKLFEAVAFHEGDIEQQKLRNLLMNMEKVRMSNNRSASAIRTINSSIVLIKAYDKNSEPRFLLQHNKSWGDYYWWIGGIEEIKDVNHLACAKRELNEELGIKEKHISEINFIGTSNEDTFSKRLGVLTSYSYNIYTLNLIVDNDIDKLFKMKNTIYLPLEGHHVKRDIKWFTWKELKNNKDLKNDAKSILQFIKSKKLHTDFISCQKIVE